MALYHFTRLDTFLNYILPSGTLMTNSLASMNDPRESHSWTFGGTNLPYDKLFPNYYSNQTHIDCQFKFGQMIKDRFQVICFSGANQNGWDNEMMWAHYADRQKGICLEFDEEALKASICNHFPNTRYEIQDVNYEEKIKNRDAWVEWNGRLSHDENFRNFLEVLCRKVTFNKSHFWEKSHASALAREQELGKQKSRLVAMASHEFRSPLSQIQLSASLVERYYQRLDQAKILAHLQKIRMAVGEMTDTLNDFLSLERIEAGTFVPELRLFDLIVFGEEVLAQMQTVAGEHELIYQHEGKKHQVYSDRNLLKHCVINLLSNAIKYSSEPGKIQLKTSLKDKAYSIEVTDHGIGIPRAEQQKLFEPFFRASNASQISGTGLGLHIVQNYVSQLSGKIRLTSSENNGTTFLLTFPLLQSAGVIAQHQLQP